MSLEAFAREAWYSRNPDITASLVSYGLIPFSVIYGAIMKRRRRFYFVSPEKSARFAIPIICVGNLTVGGSGKTPTTMLIARRLKELGRRPVIISRGYKGENKGRCALVHDGEKLMMSARQAGDEPVMMATCLKDVPVVIGAKRKEAVAFALANLAVDCAVLDDGFSHLALSRDLDVLCVNGPLGFGNKRLLPSGPLREPISAASRARLCMVNYYSIARPGIHETLLESGFSGAIMELKYKVNHFESIDGETIFDGKDLTGKNILAFAALAHSEPFFNTLSRMGQNLVVTQSFSDHYRYEKGDLERLDNLAKGRGIEYYVTTQKDAVKIAEMEADIKTTIVAAVLQPEMTPDNRRMLDEVLKGAL